MGRCLGAAPWPVLFLFLLLSCGSADDPHGSQEQGGTPSQPSLNCHRRVPSSLPCPVLSRPMNVPRTGPARGVVGARGPASSPLAFSLHSLPPTPRQVYSWVRALGGTQEGPSWQGSACWCVPWSLGTLCLPVSPGRPPSPSEAPLRALGPGQLWQCLGSGGGGEDTLLPSFPFASSS